MNTAQELAMNTQTSATMLKPVEMGSFKEKAHQLMLMLQGNDLEGALRCINEINLINNDHVHTVLGKITRGLHSAITDLSLSTSNTQSDKNKTRAGLDYVIEVTSTAAKKTLDMTEQTHRHLQTLGAAQTQLVAQIDELRQTLTTPQQQGILANIDKALGANNETFRRISHNTTEIIVAQNFQDLASQSITKAIRIITEVENSLIQLTQHTNLLKQLSLISTSPDLLEMSVAEELKLNLDRIDTPQNASEPEHLDQDEVDNLLSSLGF